VSNNYGDVAIIDYNDWNKRLSSIYKPREWCETMVYSPNEELLAIGGHDDTIYIYKTNESGEYTLQWEILHCHSSAVLGMDWSRDSRYLRAVDQAYAKMYYDVENSQKVNDGGTSLNDPTLWKTVTCKLGW